MKLNKYGVTGLCIMLHFVIACIELGHLCSLQPCSFQLLTTSGKLSLSDAAGLLLC